MQSFIASVLGVSCRRLCAPEFRLCERSAAAYDFRTAWIAALRSQRRGGMDFRVVAYGLTAI